MAFFHSSRNAQIMRFPSASEPGDRDTCPSSGRCGADGAVRRNSCPRRKPSPSARQQNGAYRAWTGSFFSSVQPFSQLQLTFRTGPAEKPRTQKPCRSGNLAGLYRQAGALTSPRTHFFTNPQTPSSSAIKGSVNAGNVIARSPRPPLDDRHETRHVARRLRCLAQNGIGQRHSQ